MLDWSGLLTGFALNDPLKPAREVGGAGRLLQDAITQSAPLRDRPFAVLGGKHEPARDSSDAEVASELFVTLGAQVQLDQMHS